MLHLRKPCSCWMDLCSYTLFPAPWIQQIWVYHRFGHFEYNHSIGV